MDRDMLDETGGRRFEPSAKDWRGFSWSTGRFDAGRRDLTRAVEGCIEVPHHLVMVTLSGSARRVEVDADCGHRYSGPDMQGAVSFVPAGCGRRLRMNDVQAEWASISLRPDLLGTDIIGTDDDRPLDIPAFTNRPDPFIFSLVSEIARLRDAASIQSSEYCAAMAAALARHLACRYGRVAETPFAPGRLPPWRLRRITEYVEANLDREIHTADLARIAELSAGHFHRALRDTTGQTPLEFVTARRIERARQLLSESAMSVTELCLEVGFSSPSHFARLFRRATGLSPMEYRGGVRKQR